VTEVQFKLAGALADSDPRTVAVQIRDLQLDPVAQGVASEPLDLEPGRYIAQARLAEGTTASAELSIEAEKEAVITLGARRPLSAAEERGSVLGAVGSFLARAAPSRRSMSLPISVANHGLRAYVRGEGVASYVPTKEVVEPDIERLEDGAVRVRFPEELEIGLVAVEAPGQPPENVVLPCPPFRPRDSGEEADDGSYGVELRLMGERGEGVDTTVHLRHGVADAMLLYSDRILFAEAQALVSSRVMQAEKLLYQKRTNALAAAAGAYVLLRAGELERLHDWTTNLRNWFPWLADGAAIAAEHLAREGRHGEALECLLELRERGLPAFSDGLGYAVNRLTVYISSGIAGPDADGLLDELSAYALVADLRRTFTTFPGADPNNPGSQSSETSTGAPTQGQSPKPEVAIA
jgi:hypothetical protein